MKIFLMVVLVVALIGGGYYLFVYRPSIETPVIEETAAEDNGENEDVSPAPAAGKLDINVVCESALAYMSFPDGESAANFVAECKAGEHPEVIERYKTDMGFSSDAAI